MKDLKKLKGFDTIIYIIVGSYILLGCLMSIFYFSIGEEQAGQFGDMFGGITALFGSLTFAGVLYTIILQRKELKLTRKELELTRAEFQEQNKTSKLHQQTARIQRIENSFFNLISLYNSVKGSVYCYGQVGLSAILSELKNKQGRFRVGQTEEKTKVGAIYASEKDFSVEKLEHFRELYEGGDSISEYYSLVMNILVFIKDSKITHDRKQFLVNTFISLTSQTELILILLFLKLYRDNDNTYNIRELNYFAAQFGIFLRVDFKILSINPSYRDLLKVL